MSVTCEFTKAYRSMRLSRGIVIFTPGAGTGALAKILGTSKLNASRLAPVVAGGRVTWNVAASPWGDSRRSPSVASVSRKFVAAPWLRGTTTVSEGPPAMTSVVVPRPAPPASTSRRVTYSRISAAEAAPGRDARSANARILFISALPRTTA